MVHGPDRGQNLQAVSFKDHPPIATVEDAGYTILEIASTDSALRLFPGLPDFLFAAAFASSFFSSAIGMWTDMMC
jgi:hypothetical protein